MPDSILDKFKKLGVDIMSRAVVPFFAVDDTPPDLADGEARPARLDKETGGVVVYVANSTGTTASGSADNNVGAAVSKTVKSSAGRLISMSVRHADAADLFLWIWDSTTTSGTALIVPTRIPAATHVVVGTDFFTTAGLAFATGLTYGFSTSGSTYSAYGTAASCFATMVYE